MEPPASTDRRGQASLLALVVSLVVLTSVMGIALTIVDTAYRSADREPEERRIATTLAQRLVSADAEQTVRANVVNVTALRALSLDRTYPFTRDTALRVRLGNETIAERGEPTGGTTVRRVVLRAHSQSVTRTVPETTTVPGGAKRPTITVPASGSVTTVRANGRVVFHDPAGLVGSFELPRSHESIRLRITGGTGPITVSYGRIQAEPTELVVTVDA